MVYLHPDEPGVYIYLGFGFGFGFGLIRVARPDQIPIPILAHISTNNSPILLQVVPMDRSHPSEAVHT